MNAETGCDAQQARLFTVSPLRTSLNFYSLGRTREESARLVSAMRRIDAVTEMFDVEYPDWSFGYGTVQHDALPVFFQPVAILRMRLGSGLPVVRDDRSFTAIGAEIHLYDDCVAILFVEWATDVDACPREDFDSALTGATKSLFRRHVLGCLETMQEALSRDDTALKVLRARDEFSVFTPLHALPDAPDWTARSVLVTGGPETAVMLSGKLGGLPPMPEEFDGARAWVGSGNSLFAVTSGRLEAFTQDWMRCMSLCQFYATLLSRYQAMLLGDLRLMENAGDREIKKTILRTLERKLDHLDFIRLQHERALYGLQGIRRPLCRYIHEAWESALQFGNVEGWAAFLRKQIDRYYRRRQLAQTRILKSIVAAIGSFSLFDLFLVLRHESDEQEDGGLPGILDIFAGHSADTVLYGALVILLFLMLITYLNEK